MYSDFDIWLEIYIGVTYYSYWVHGTFFVLTYLNEAFNFCKEIEIKNLQILSLLYMVYLFHNSGNPQTHNLLHKESIKSHILCHENQQPIYVQPLIYITHTLYKHFLFKSYK